MNTTSVLYDIDSKPPLIHLVLLGLQYIVKFSLLLVCTLLIGQAAGLQSNGISQLLSMTLFTSAIMTLWFSLKKVGGGYFLPIQASVPFFALSIMAAHSGGIGLIAVAALIAALTQAVVSPLIARLQGQVIHEAVSIMILMLGVWAAALGVNELFHPGYLGDLIVHHTVFHNHIFNLASSIPGIITLLVLLILKPWRHHRLHCILYAMIMGCAIGWASKTTLPIQFNQFEHLAWFSWPHFFAYKTFHFHASIILPSIIVGIITAFQAFSIVDTIDHTLSRPKCRKRMLKVQAATTLTTAMGSFGGAMVSIVPGGIGDFITSGAYSRYIAWVYAPILLILAFLPKVATCLLLIPASVNGAVIVFMGAMMVMKGLVMLDLTNMPNVRAKCYGVALIIGILSLVTPTFIASNAHWTPWLTNPATFYCFVLLFILLMLLRLRGMLHG